MGAPTPVSQLPSNVIQLVTNTVNQWNSTNDPKYHLNPNDVLGIVAVESSGNPDAINHNKNGSTDYGLMQLNDKSFPNASSLNPVDNVRTGVNYVGSLLQAAGGDTAQAIGAYHAGPKNGLTESGVEYNGKVQASKAGTDYEGVTPDGSDVLSGDNLKSVIVSPTANPYSPLTNNSQNVNLNDLVPQIVIQEGLDVMPWYSDPGLITGNPRLRREVQPVSFKVMLHDNNDFLLSSRGETGVPVVVQLNASMKAINWSMKHVYHHQRTRTAHLITLWGMQADTIEGQCTTGVFMNQFGLTDYYSTRVINDNLKNLVTSGELFKEGTHSNDPKTNSSTNVLLNTGDRGFQDTMNNASKSNPYFTQTDAFRVAAQDAFMEFLALFKMNGSVWFWNKLYSDGLGSIRDWAGVQAWSPTLGLNGAQKQARNNDVLTRGGVLMSYKNFVYKGYFKTLQWEIDSKKPFSWNFNFVFQVERTVGQQFTLGK